MKQAWEAAEPGRAAKALAAREKFLKEHLIKLEPDEETAPPQSEQGEGAEADGKTTLNPVSPIHKKPRNCVL